MKEKKEIPDKGVFTWGAFTAIMIIVVCAAVLVLFFHVRLGSDEKPTTTNKNVINESMIDRGYIQTENGTSIEIKNGTETTNPTEETDETAETTNEVVENTVVE